jgi:hypothetical protein
MDILCNFASRRYFFTSVQIDYFKADYATYISLNKDINYCFLTFVTYTQYQKIFQIKLGHFTSYSVSCHNMNGF